MFLRMKRLPGVDNLRNYPAEIIRELEELLLSGGSALPDPKRNGIYDLENFESTFFIQNFIHNWKSGVTRNMAEGVLPAVGCETRPFAMTLGSV
jgi:hypothetical protein